MLPNTLRLWGLLAIVGVCHALGRDMRGAEDWSLTLESERTRSRYDHFEHFATGASLDLVANSGVCETTRNVKQYSGYLNVGPNMNMWFWFFEARHDPKNAPTAAWFNGGPGCSSMIGLFSV
jgi:carboxypeptidase C (cathepsin A)